MLTNTELLTKFTQPEIGEICLFMCYNGDVSLYIIEVTLDDADAKRFSVVLRERLRQLNNKEYSYILVANKMPAQYRGTAQLSFLQNIPWLAVFDLFDAASKRDGLHYACNETTDGPRARNRTLDDFNEVSPDKDSYISTRGTTWILNNEEMQKGDWIKCSKDCLHRTLFAYKQCFAPGKLVCVFLGLGENAVEEMADIIESCFSILGKSAGSCVTIISESKSVAEALINASKPSLRKELRECCVAGIPWVLFEEIALEMVGPSKFDERGATTELPFYSGTYKKVHNKVINSWEDLEVYSPSPRLPNLMDVIEKERYAFYKGAQVSQINLFHEHSIHRTLEDEVNNKVDRALKSLCNAEYGAYQDSSDTNCQVRTITVPYEPGSGATTLCRRILWKRRTDYRCAVVKAITTSTDYFIEKLQSISYDEKNSTYSLPVLVLVDNFPESDARHLTERIMKRQTKCVLLNTFSIAKTATISNLDLELTPLRKLDETERALVRNILINITSDAERRREVVEVLEREKRFIWFGLELFGRDYLQIEERLKNHINSILMDSLGIREMLLNMCCFLYKYSEGYSILPHSVVLDVLYYSSARTEGNLLETKDVHEVFGGLLLEEQNETNGYYGWRPAHALVSEVVTSRISIEDTAVYFLKKICNWKTYAVKVLRQQVFKVLLERKRISDPVFLEEQGAEDGSDGSTDLEDDVFGFLEVRTRYSPVIEDILKQESNTSGALRVLITICEEAIQTEEKSYAWQQLARFIGYQMRDSEMSENDDLHKRLYKVMTSENEQDPLPMPRTGLEAAHIAVDIAIHHQPNYSHHYVTKGVLYRWQLTEMKERPNLLLSLPGMIEICRKALEVYDKALTASYGQNHYSMIGKIQAIVSLLETVKSLPCFGNEDESFTRFLQTGEIPWVMADVLPLNEQEYVLSLSSTTLDLLNELFGYVKLKQATTYDENKIRGLNNAKIRASELRRTFYKITGYDRRQISVESSMPLSTTTNEEPALYQQIVQDVLFIRDETPYSAWSNLSDGDIVSIYNMLKPLCLHGYGHHNDLLIFSKACLQLKERPPVDELEIIVSKWVTKFPNSVWAHLFNYMIHFPIPNGSLAPFNQNSKASIKKCESIVREKAGFGFRKSGAEYFLGKGRGLNAIVGGQEFRWFDRKKTKTDFWRRKETTEKLERVQGQKDVTLKGVITYQGIQLHFDNTLYPNESKDDLWFYIGFSVAGPYAYDPVDNDTYADLSRQARETSSVSVVHPSSEASISGNKRGTLPGTLSRVKPRMSVNPPKLAGPERLAPSGVSQTRRLAAQASIRSSMPSRNREELLQNTHSISTFHDPSISSGSYLCHLPQQATPGRTLYSSALQHNSARNQVSLDARKRDAEMSPKQRNNLKSVNGSRGTENKVFNPMYVDSAGKVHHGAYVLGLPKSKECTVHTSPKSGLAASKQCNYAHSWKSDTRQFVCTKCTDKNFTFCKKKIDHEEFIWDLGQYYNASGTIWKDSSGPK